MLSTLAYLALAMAFLLGVYGVAMSLWGLAQKSKPAVESARLSLILLFLLVTFSLIALLTLLLTDRFDVAYVYSVVSRNMPVYLKMTALWGGQSGSLLFWSWLLAAFSLIFAFRKWDNEQEMLPWALLVVFLCLAFFLALNVLFDSPFERFWQMPDGQRFLSVFQPAGARSLIPVDGQGLNPLLRHPGMIWHPPALYLGFVGFLVPFAFAIASLGSGRKDQHWLELARPWTLIAWIFLSLGLVLGMRWAYDVLGWGGYWGWDPVEIAALLPWLSGTALIHTALMSRKLRHFARWNLFLIIITFTLVILGTFLTRSGLLSSVHSFAASNVGLPMFVFTALVALGSLGLLFFRWKRFGPSDEMVFVLSKEVLTFVFNLILLSILLICLLGVVYPLVSELLTGTQITVGPEWYKQITGPLFLFLLLLTGICPLAAWSGKQIVKGGKTFWLVGLISLIFPFAAWLIGGVRHALTLGALWLAALSGMLILSEYFKHVHRLRKRHNENWANAFWLPFKRSHRKYGGLLVHLGVVLMSLGIIGLEGLQQEIQVTLDRGERAALAGYQFQFAGLEWQGDEGGISTTRAVVEVSRDETFIGSLYPQRDIYLDMGLAVTQPSMRSSLAKDIYAILVDFDAETQNAATFRLYINPLVNWLWIGVGVMTLGTLVALLPDEKRKPE